MASGWVPRLPDSNVAYRVMTPMEIMARLSALMPPPAGVCGDAGGWAYRAAASKAPT